MGIEENIQKVAERGSRLLAHWVPGYKDMGNELADQQVKAGAQEMLLS